MRPPGLRLVGVLGVVRLPPSHLHGSPFLPPEGQKHVEETVEDQKEGTGSPHLLTLSTCREGRWLHSAGTLVLAATT